MNKDNFPLWRNDGKPAASFSKWNRANVEKLHNAIKDGELRFIENHCLCNNEHPERDIVISEKDRFGLPIPQILCSKCGVIRSGVVFDEESNSSFYEKYYRGVYTTECPSDVFFQKQTETGTAAINLMKEHVDFAQIKNVAEIGCGAGGILLPFKNEGKSVTGYDFDEKYLEYGRKMGLNLVYGDFYTQTEDNSCDLIIMNHVFEHLLSPLDELRRLLPKLKCNGYIYFEIPGIYCISWCYPDPLTYFQNAHVYNFYKQQLYVLFQKYGIKIIYGDDRCTFICQKTDNNIPDVDCIYDKSLSDYPRKNANYLMECKKKYEKRRIRTFKKKLRNIALALGWKQIRPYIKRNKTYSN
jgi:2-polyprenyl-3-methyl-5-hydroxy-6-metoxy-1,4-benzoquinol methylase